VNQYLYRAFGEQTDVIEEGISNRFTWVGRLGYYREPDLDTYWLRARVYDPQRGRFVSRDPIREANLYRWPGNSPVGRVDPGGEGPASISERIGRILERFDDAAAEALKGCFDRAVLRQAECQTACGWKVGLIGGIPTSIAFLLGGPIGTGVGIGLTISSLIAFRRCKRGCGMQRRDDLTECWLAWRQARHRAARRSRRRPPGRPRWARARRGQPWQRNR
jgi:RHS repeat-associated protein